jgi:hypothetical protein
MDPSRTVVPPLELGAKLFIRSTRQFRVTAVGQAFLEKAHVALQALKQGKELIADITSLWFWLAQRTIISRRQRR